MKRIAGAVTASLAIAVVFEGALFAAKEIPGIYDHAPWLNDPYDTAVSFALFCVPIILVPCALRLLAGRPGPQAPARAADLCRACGAVLAVVGVTLAACWAALALGANRSAWTSVTGVQVGMLALLSASTLACAVGIRRAAGAAALARRDAAAPALTPDWLADLTAAGRVLARLAGPAGRPVARLLDSADGRVLPLVRRHPVGTALLLGAVIGLAVTVSQAVREGYQAGVAAVFFSVVTAGVFAFVVTAGSYLRVVRADRPATARAPVIHATVLAAAAVPIALAFRATLWSLVGASPQASGLGALCVLLASAALVAFAASLAAERVVRSRWLAARPR